MDPSRVEALDTYPFRERLGAVMRPLPPMVPADGTLSHAVQILDETASSAVAVADAEGKAAGLITERDVVRTLSRHQDHALAVAAATVMTAPIAAMPAETRLYKAISRMERLGLRHLGVTDAGRLVGLITPRQFLRRRASGAFALADALENAPDGPSLAAARKRLAIIAADLRKEDMGAIDIAELLAEALRDTTRRCAELVEAEMGPPPGDWCVLILGSGGRGETLLGGDQDNAIIHSPGAEMETWCAKAGERLAAMLGEVGVPLCKGNIMTSNPEWRGDLATWEQRLSGWWRVEDAEALLDVDIFYDCQPVHGDLALGDQLRRYALAGAQQRMPFLAALAQHLSTLGTALNWFGGLRTDHGMIDLKLGGTFPIVAAARTLALRRGISTTSTPSRIQALMEAEVLSPGDGQRLIEGLELLMGLILDQQLSDLAAGQPLTTKVEVEHLGSHVKSRLKESLKQVDMLANMVRQGLAG
ncbi:MAG: DUF294 nucleotidyltransferase-like domain-containing protein [Alphaproteobacteria bacterium]|nr:DUF294 nucleotidyltransferase-like domain-containing protein [Alphaproteobacteria bacterium]